MVVHQCAILDPAKDVISFPVKITTHTAHTSDSKNTVKQYYGFLPFESCYDHLVVHQRADFDAARDA